MRVRRFFRLYAFAALLPVLLLAAACGENTPIPPPQSTRVPSPSENPYVLVKDQVYDGASVVVQEVYSDGPGWITVHSQENGLAGPTIGIAHLNDGINKEVSVSVDPTQVTTVMYAILHVDKGVIGTYEYPGPDEPVRGDPGKTAPSFKATINQHPNLVPSVKVKDQDVQDGVVVIDQVTSNGQGWIAVHPQGAEDAGDTTLGFKMVKDGTTTGLKINIDTTRATGVLYAMLHVDNGEKGMYEFPDADPPVVVNGEEVSVPFHVTINGQKATAPTGTPAPTETRTVTPTLTATSTLSSTPTSTLTLTPSLTPIPTATRTPTSTPIPTITITSPAAAAVPTIRVGDQAIENKTVTVAEVLVTQDAWLVIRRLNGDGNMGAIAGYAHIQKGLNENVAVTVDTTITSDILAAQILEDNGTPGKLEYPTPDIPLEVNGAPVAAMFKVIRFSDGGTIVGVYPDPVNGLHVVVGHAQSVYISANDAPGQSNCTGDCQKLWRPVIQVGRVVYSAGVQKDKLGFLPMPDGSVWLTYNGYPLYTFAKDFTPGSANGMGGGWSLVTP